MKNLLRVIFTPSCWVQNYQYSKAWDDKLIHLLETEKFENITECEATIGGYRIWIANHPYASFVCGNDRPSRSTILKAKDILDKNKYN